MRVFAVAMLVLPLAACGGGSSGGGTTSDIEITIWPSGKSGDSTTHRIQCPGDDRCERLEALPARLFEPVPEGVACTQIYGGPDAAEIKGTIAGRQVDATFKRTDGCEIARWNQVAFLFA
jgi:hypothetical protein